MVNWKEPDAPDRLIGALLAAHPEFKPDYNAVAQMFGRGATYFAVEGQFRKFREIAKVLPGEAARNGVQINNVRPKSASRVPRAPRTPRSQSAGVTKSTGRGKASLKKKDSETPTKTKSGKALGKSLLDAINVSDGDGDDDDGEDDEKRSVKSETADVNDAVIEIKDEEKEPGTPSLIPREPTFTPVNSQKNGFECSNAYEDDGDVFSEYA